MPSCLAYLIPFSNFSVFLFLYFYSVLSSFAFDTFLLVCYLFSIIYILVLLFFCTVLSSLLGSINFSVFFSLNKYAVENFCYINFALFLDHLFVIYLLACLILSLQYSFYMFSPPLNAFYILLKWNHGSCSYQCFMLLICLHCCYELSNLRLLAKVIRNFCLLTTFAKYMRILCPSQELFKDLPVFICISRLFFSFLCMCSKLV